MSCVVARRLIAPSLAALALVALPVPAFANGLIDNVNGIALDKSGKTIAFTGLVVGDDGKVEKLLERRDKRPDKPEYKLDGKGRTLIPGLIDGHGHVMELGFQLLTLDLSGAKSLPEALEMIRAYAAANPARKWILGGGWNQEQWSLGRYPTAAELDAVVPDVPVWLSRVDGHAGWANSAAMKAAGVTAASASPAGGRIEMAGGKPSGVFVDNAQALVAKFVPPPLPKDRDLALEAAQKQLLAWGITGIADMGTSIEDWQAYRRAGDRGALRVRILSYGSGVDNTILIAGSSPSPWLYDDHLRLVGAKLYMDGALGSRGAWLKADYADAPGQRGLPRLSGSQLRNLMSRLALDNFQIAVHAIGDQANAEVLAAIDELADTYKGDRRWRIEHAQIIDIADLPRFAQHGTIASMQPVHESSDWRMAIARMGESRLGGAYAWRSMLNNHVPLAFGSDVPVESANPFPGLAVAMTREDAKGQPFGGWHPDQRLTFDEALKAFTQGAAYAGFAEDRLGTLAPGMAADFLIVDRDISLARPAEIRDTQVLETWIGGKRVFVKKD